jgi:dethiobiotin synthetase
MSRGLFITGTGTGVGKTYVAALVARELTASGRRVGVYKPVASGCDLCDGRLMSPDAITLWQAVGAPPGLLDDVCPQRFAAPLAPHRAAQAEGKSVDGALLRSGLERWRQTSDIVLVEGAGGLMSPIEDETYNADLAAEFGYPLLVVAANELGTINATLQTLITAGAYGGGLRVAGIVLNSPALHRDDPSRQSNREELARRCDAPLLAEVSYGGQLDRDVDWWALAAV